MKGSDEPRTVFDTVIGPVECTSRDDYTFSNGWLIIRRRDGGKETYRLMDTPDGALPP